MSANQVPAEEEKKQSYVMTWAADPTMPCFQIAHQQKEEIAAFLQKFKKVPAEG